MLFYPLLDDRRRTEEIAASSNTARYFLYILIKDCQNYDYCSIKLLGSIRNTQKYYKREQTNMKEDLLKNLILNNPISQLFITQYIFMFLLIIRRKHNFAALIQQLNITILLIYNYIKIMEKIQQKSKKYANSIRRQQREQIFQSKRQWNELPSAIFDLPFRIQRNDWSYFQQSLDSIQVHDRDLIDASFKKYLFDEWNNIKNKQWTNPSCFNLIRSLLRVNIAEKEHYLILLEMALEAKCEFDTTKQVDGGIAIIKTIKEIAISMLIDTSKQKHYWQGQILDKLHQFLSSLKIMEFAGSLKDLNVQIHFKNFLPYYLVLLADKRISLEQFVKADNTNQLFYLLSDSFEKNGSFEMANIIKLIKKCFSMKESKYSSVIKSAIKIFFFQGIQQTLKFLDNGISDNRKQGSFFNKLLHILNQTDFQTLSNGIQLLALIFDQYDECIPVILETKNPEIACVSNSSEKYYIAKPTIYLDFISFIESLMEHLSFQIRLKTYWLISNVTGSSTYFQHYGFRFISKIYTQNYYSLQLASENQIGHQISLCILNYLCNITNHNQIQQLVSLAYKPESSKNIKQKLIHHSGPNCFAFALKIISNTLQKLLSMIEDNSSLLSNDQCVGVLHRCTYALEMVFEHSNDYSEMAIGLLQTNKVPLLLQQIDVRLSGSSSSNQQLRDSIKIIEDHFSKHSQIL